MTSAMAQSHLTVNDLESESQGHSNFKDISRTGTELGRMLIIIKINRKPYICADNMLVWISHRN